MSPRSARFLLVAAPAGLLAGASFLLRSGAARWRRRTEARLTAGSSVAETARGPIEYGTAGEGAPVLVLHGTPGGYDQGLAAAAFLPLDGLRLIAPSRPGYLRTPLSVGETPAEQADALVGLLDRLGLARVAVLGASGGGPAAVEIALRHPERVSRLVLWEAVTARKTLETGNLTRGPLATDLGAWLLLSAFRIAPGRLVPAEVARDPRALARIVPLAETSFPVALRREGILNDARQIGALPDYPLGEIRVPTLLVHGTADTNVPYAQSERAAARIPGARLVSLPGADHTTGLVRPEAADAIAAFLRETDAAAGA